MSLDALLARLGLSSRNRRADTRFFLLLRVPALTDCQQLRLRNRGLAVRTRPGAPAVSITCLDLPLELSVEALLGKRPISKNFGKVLPRETALKRRAGRRPAPPVGISSRCRPSPLATPLRRACSASIAQIAIIARRLGAWIKGPKTVKYPRHRLRRPPTGLLQGSTQKAASGFPSRPSLSAAETSLGFVSRNHLRRRGFEVV